MNIVITGASSGIGYQTALILSENPDNRVVAISRNKTKLDELKSESLRKNSNSNLHTIAGDISNEKSVTTLVQEINSNFKNIHILINNAGLLINKPFEELTMQDWIDVYSTNVFGTVNLTKELLPLFSSSSKGSIPGPAHIVNISSMGGFQGSAKFKGLSAYSSSKAALAGITECLAEELKEKNIAVNCLCLGSVNTEMFVAAFPGSRASSSPEETANFIAKFSVEGQNLFNGKIIPVADSTP
jgi:NAD(P)-dependent dehydrogenase (short-subunit alcohol dehydrogenase family)